MKKKDIFFGLGVAIALALFIAPLASPWPDGLEKVAQDKGFLESGEMPPILFSPIPDYLWPGVKEEKVATAIAGVFGTIGVFVFVYGIGILFRKKKQFD